MNDKEELKREYQDWAVNKAKSMIPTDIIVETPDWWLDKTEQARRERDEELIERIKNLKIQIGHQDGNAIAMIVKEHILQIIKHQDDTDKNIQK